MQYVVSSVISLSPTAVVLTLRPATDEHMTFLSGQYAGLRFKRHGRYTPVRCFSMVNALNGSGEVQFGVRVQGAFSRAVQSLRAGKTVELLGPYGQFVYDPSVDKYSVMIAGGIGITPIMGILATHVPANPDNRFTLLYSVRSQQDMPFVETLQTLQQQYANFRAVFIVGEEPDGRSEKRNVIHGRLSSQLITKASADEPEHTSYFICGPAGFMDIAVGIVGDLGADPRRVYTESFSQSQVTDISGLALLRERLASIYGVSAVAVLALFAIIAFNAANSSKPAGSLPQQSAVTPAATTPTEAAAPNQPEITAEAPAPSTTESVTTLSPNYESPTTMVS